MKPYDKSNSFMRRVTKRVSEIIPGTTWMNMLLGESQSVDDPTSRTENDDQPPVKKLCTSNNTFVSTNNRTCVNTSSSVNSADNYRNSRARFSEISAVTCVPSTSRQSPKCTSHSNSSLLGHDVGYRSSLKRKSDVPELSNINKQNSKTAFNFASSTPTLVIANKPPVTTINSKRSLNSGKLSTSNEFSASSSSKLMSKGESHSVSICPESTKKNISSPSFRWDTFVNYGELSERQKLFAQKSPLNCSQVMYGGRSAQSNLSKILGNTPPIHRKAVIPISPTNNSEIRTTSSILLGHISTKDKEIEENKFFIQPRVHLRHKADQKSVPLKVETTVKTTDTTPEKLEEKSIDASLICSGRDASRKLRANISKKARGLKSEELEMPAKVDLPNVSLKMPVLPSIKLSNYNVDDNEFTFNQPLTIEQFGLQFVKKTSRKKQKMTKKTQNTDSSSKDNLSFTFSSPSCSVSIKETSKIENEKVSVTNKGINVKNSYNNDEVSELCKFGDDAKDIPNKSFHSSGSKLEFTKPANMVFGNSSQILQSNNEKQQPEKLLVELKKWTCDACWVSNDTDKINCVACQTPKDSTQKPLKVSKSTTWTCETCWVPNKSEIDVCVACQSQKPGTTKKVVEQNSTWTCDACWVKNKSECNSCISCGTAKPGSVPENKPQPLTQFKFGLNNNTFKKSGSSQFKFGFDNGNTDQSSSQFKFGSPATFKTSENVKPDSSTTEFKFGMVNNKADQPLGTFKFGIDSAASQPLKKFNEVSDSNSTDKPLYQFKFGSENKSDQPESQFKFGLNTTTNKPTVQLKFGSDNVESENPVQQNLSADSNKLTQFNNEFLVDNRNEISEKSPVDQLQSNGSGSLFKFGDTKQTENSTSQVIFGSVEVNCNNSNSLVDIGHKNDDSSKGKFVWDKKNKVEINPILNFHTSQAGQFGVGNTDTVQLVNGHSHTNEDQKPSLIKTSHLFSFGSFAKQDKNLPDDQKTPTTFTFGSATNDKKLFVTPALAATSFPSTGPVFGASNSVFGSGPTTSTSVASGSTVITPHFSFGSVVPPNSNSFFSSDYDKNPLGQANSLTTKTTNVGFSFGVKSPPVFSVANTGGFKNSVQADGQTKITPNIVFNQSSIKQAVKLDPNAPISINFTGGTAAQFTAKPETTEPPTKRKILKPVRRIR